LAYQSETDRRIDSRTAKVEPVSLDSSKRNRKKERFKPRGEIPTAAASFKFCLVWEGNL
jgi:hypothetical protein